MCVCVCEYVQVWAVGTHVWVVVGGLGEDVVHVLKRVLEDHGAQHAIRAGELRAIDARAASCVCQGVSTRCTSMGDARGSRRTCGPGGIARPRWSGRSARPS